MCGVVTSGTSQGFRGLVSADERELVSFQPLSLQVPSRCSPPPPRFPGNALSLADSGALASGLPALGTLLAARCACSPRAPAGGRPDPQARPDLSRSPGEPSRRGTPCPSRLPEPARRLLGCHLSLTSVPGSAHSPGAGDAGG